MGGLKDWVVELDDDEEELDYANSDIAIKSQSRGCCFIRPLPPIASLANPLHYVIVSHSGMRLILVPCDTVSYLHPVIYPFYDGNFCILSEPSVSSRLGPRLSYLRPRFTFQDPRRLQGTGSRLGSL